MPDKPTTTTEALAALIGATPKTVRELARRGIVVRTGRDRYDRDASVRKYCAHLRDLATGRGGETAAANVAIERARLLQAQADVAELKAAQLRGTLVDVGEVERGWAAKCSDLRSGVLAWPSRCAAQLPHLNAHDISVMDLEVRAVLTELSEDGRV